MKHYISAVVASLALISIVAAESPKTLEGEIAAPQRAFDLDTIKDKVSISLCQRSRFKLTPDGRLLIPKKVERAGDDKATVEIKLDVTDSTPFRVRGVATRPFLTVSNGYERTLHYRLLARLKGGKEFFEVGGVVEPVAPGDTATRCWESGSQVEELVLFQFALTPTSSK